MARPSRLTTPGPGRTEEVAVEDMVVAVVDTEVVVADMEAAVVATEVVAVAEEVVVAAAAVAATTAAAVAISLGSVPMVVAPEVVDVQTVEVAAVVDKVAEAVTPAEKADTFLVNAHKEAVVVAAVDDQAVVADMEAVVADMEAVAVEDIKLVYKVLPYKLILESPSAVNIGAKG